MPSTEQGEAAVVVQATAPFVNDPQCSVTVEQDPKEGWLKVQWRHTETVGLKNS